MCGAPLTGLTIHTCAGVLFVTALSSRSYSWDPNPEKNAWKRNWYMRLLSSIISFSPFSSHIPLVLSLFWSKCIFYPSNYGIGPSLKEDQKVLELQKKMREEEEERELQRLTQKAQREQAHKPAGAAQHYLHTLYWYAVPHLSTMWQEKMEKRLFRPPISKTRRLNKLLFKLMGQVSCNMQCVLSHISFVAMAYHGTHTHITQKWSILTLMARRDCAHSPPRDLALT